MHFVQPGADRSPFADAFSVRSAFGADGSGVSSVNPPAPQRLAALPADGVARQPWPGVAVPSNQAPLPASDGSWTDGGANSMAGGFLGLINRLIAQLSSLIGQAGSNGGSDFGVNSQSISDGTFASTGDPHLSEKATIRDSFEHVSPVDRHFDSMTGHDNLLSSQDVDGGYRLSTSVTSPSDKGVTMNAAATVHLNNERDTVTLRNDGSSTITSDGNDVTIAAGQTVTLAGGEQVARNVDGSITVVGHGAGGGSVTTTLSAKSGGVDATATVHELTVSGDVVNGGAAAVPQRRIGTSGDAPVIANAFA